MNRVGASSIQWVDPDTPLPSANSALTDPPGLVAAGLDLSVRRLEQAYSDGIFPWFNPGEPVLWWSPDPRAVLFCDELHLSRSMAKRLRKIARDQAAGDLNSCVVTIDCAFPDVIDACASRGAHPGEAVSIQTWISPEMKHVYQKWHESGRAHSVETWINGELAGGLYGVSMGRMFFGESMFSRQTDASKIALVHLVRFLARHEITMIDCQMSTAHLHSLGAREIERKVFLEHIHVATRASDLHWQAGWLDTEGALHFAFPDDLKVCRLPS